MNNFNLITYVFFRRRSCQTCHGVETTPHRSDKQLCNESTVTADRELSCEHILRIHIISDLHISFFFFFFLPEITCFLFRHAYNALMYIYIFLPRTLLTFDKRVTNLFNSLRTINLVVTMVRSIGCKYAASMQASYDFRAVNRACVTCNCWFCQNTAVQ